MRHFKHISWHQRLELYRYLYILKLSKKEIADRLGVHISTVYREIKKGEVSILNQFYDEINVYSPDVADENYKKLRKNCGRDKKIIKNGYSLQIYENIIINMDYSPRACVEYIKKDEILKKTVIIISYSTIYRYIYLNYFDNLSMKHLAYYKNRHKYRNIKRQKRASAGKSIEYRDEKILLREEFGHWEMDCIEGNINSEYALLVLSERKTRTELIFKIKSHNPRDTILSLNYLEELLNNDFSKVFKTITMDNGSEFSYPDLLEKSIFNKKKKRTSCYYCHSHSPHERGTNENINRMIRRKVKKGTNFDRITKEKIYEINNWLNNYPRKILNFYSARQKFEKELKKINVKNIFNIFF